MKIFITGGAGYVGSALVPYLLSRGYLITVYDLMIYGNNNLDKHKNLKIINGDIRDQKLLQKSIKGNDIIIHLACISNDPSFELNPDLGKAINYLSFEPMLKIAKDHGLKKFIYASSSSVYGLKKETEINEEVSLEPLTDYSKYKAYCEDILNKYSSKDFVTTTIRPATVCGYARRQRLDVVVNIFTNLAYHKRSISVFGGKQLRPNIHIIDMCLAYEKLITAENKLLNSQVFNAGDENKTVEELAHIVKEEIGNDVLLEKIHSDDNRSYHISSKKIQNVLGFKNKYSIKDAVVDLKKAFDQNLLSNPLENINYFNIKKMKYITLK